MSMHYYLLASLPELTLGQPPPLSPARFLSLCEGQLAPGEMDDVRLALGSFGAQPPPEEPHPYLAAWMRIMKQLRNALACARASKRGPDAKTRAMEHRGYSGYMHNAITHALESSNPMETELELDRTRWRVAEALLEGDPFDFARVLAYAVKLRLAWRWAHMDEQAARERIAVLVKDKTSLNRNGTT